MKKIAIGSLAQESNSFSPIKTGFDDFHVLRSPEKIKEKFRSAVQVFINAGFEVETSISAYALPGGSVVKKDFIRLADELVNGISDDASGVWLMLHGAMYVQEIQSGEEYVIKRLREKLGDAIPIAVCMDMHANHTQAFIDRVTAVRGYHTAPHESWDYENCKEITAKALIRAIAGEKMKTHIKYSPLRLFGENFMTDFGAAKQAEVLSEEIEKIPGIIAATVFVGMAWVDCPYNSMSFVITADETAENTEELLKRLADFIDEKQNEFDIPAKNMLLPDAVEYCGSFAKRPFYISDSGDNVTAGAAGDNAFCLKYLAAHKKTGYLIAGIWDKDFVSACFEDEKPDCIHYSLGGSQDSQSESITGNFEILKRFSDDVEAVKNVNMVLCRIKGNYVLAADKRCSFTTEELIEKYAGNLSGYTGIFVKLGYLFPDLVENAAGNVIALTPGNSCLDKSQIIYKTNTPSEDI